ncbi:DMT family transporter [Rhodospirillum sp. A1_3_36]|uniref:DMT family transporter n=1 Tax=Rhodospirillum sp. A1_3_36 TaxID=3391666 RepID=UPI0039A76754
MSVLAPVLFLLMWSSGAIFVKLGLMSASVWTFLFLRAAGATLVLLIVLSLRYPRDLRVALTLPLRVVLKASGIGLMLQAGYQGAYFLAIAHGLSPGVLTIILGAQPLLMPWVAREAVSTAGKGLLLLGFMGLVLAVLGTRDTSTASLWGIAFGVVALVGITIGTALQKDLGLPIAQSIIWQYLGSVVVFTVCLLLAGWQATLDFPFILSTAWMVLVVSVGANLLLLYLLNRHAASQVGNVFYFIPILTLAADHYFYGAEITWMTLAGGAGVVLSSLAFVGIESRMHKKKDDSSPNAHSGSAHSGAKAETAG